MLPPYLCQSPPPIPPLRHSLLSFPLTTTKTHSISGKKVCYHQFCTRILFADIKIQHWFLKPMSCAQSIVGKSMLLYNRGDIFIRFLHRFWSELMLKVTFQHHFLSKPWIQDFFLDRFKLNRCNLFVLLKCFFVFLQ